MMRFGYPLEMVSDRGTHFLNEIIKDITIKYAIRHRKTTPYNPKANGQTERSNGTIGRMLNRMVAMHKTDWDQKLASVVHAYNTTKKTTTGKTPHRLQRNPTLLKCDNRSQSGLTHFTQGLIH